MKKIVLASLIAVSVAFAGQGDYNYEATITGGFVVPEGNLDLDNQLSLGLRIGKNVESIYYDQVELGFERSSSVDYENSSLDTNINRIFVNLVKEYDIDKNAALYALVGLGYEDYTNEQFDNNDEGFAQYGVGLKHWATDSIALKYELRHAVNFDGDNNLFATIGFVIPFGKKAVKPAPVAVKVEPTPAPVVVKKEEPKPMPVAKVVSPRDDDKDGVTNKNDLCLQTPIGRVVNANGCMKVVELHVNFATDKSDVPASIKSTLEEVSDFMLDNKNYKLSLEGHTDSVGSAKYNEGLSNRRASAVQEALNKLGVENSRVSSMGYGETKPIMTNDTEEGRAANRRVEAHFSKQRN